jgi:hypothetical protein
VELIIHAFASDGIALFACLENVVAKLESLTQSMRSTSLLSHGLASSRAHRFLSESLLRMARCVRMRRSTLRCKKVAREKCSD